MKKLFITMTVLSLFYLANTQYFTSLNTRNIKAQNFNLYVEEDKMILRPRAIIIKTSLAYIYENGDNSI